MKNQRSAASRPRSLPMLGAATTRGFVGLPHRGRVALLVLLGVILVVDLGLYLADPMTTWQGMLLGMAATCATALFAWWPAAASFSLLFMALVQTTAGQDGSQFLYLAAVAGLVVYTSPAWFSATYVIATIGIATIGHAILAAATSDMLALTAPIVLTVVLAVSLTIGWALRSARKREHRLAIDIAQLEHARAAAIDAERERISDELHDIIAHDVTLVSMHARVLERVDDPTLRDQSVRAIRDSADQALADIRRVLRIIRNDHPTSTPQSDERRTSVSGAVEGARASLADLSADITVRAVSGVVVSQSIEQTLVHLLREGTTNIAKHAPDRPTVTISLEACGEDIRLEITNSLPASPRVSGISSSGYGLDRLRERVTLLGGELSAYASDGTWTLAARLPTR